MVLVIDNYDSFVHNLDRYVKQQGLSTVIIRNDALSITEICEMKPSHIIISPGPCTPEKAGICVPLIRQFAGQIPILGVCLGHQAIGVAFGAIVDKSNLPLHGQSSTIYHDKSALFEGVPDPTVVGRYHSLSIHREKFPYCLEINAETTEGEIMAIRHKKHPVYGLQFHPESILTTHGQAILRNFFLHTSS